MREIELKFRIDERDARRLRSRLRTLADKEAPPRERNLRSVYFDTEDHALRAAGIALRMRRDGRQWIQTVKAGRVPKGSLQQVEEAECAAPGGRLSLYAIPDPALQQAVLSAINGHDLRPVCETAMRRLSGLISLEDGSRIEMAIDGGEIRAGERAAPFREIELELKQGGVEALFDLARELFPKGGLQFSRLSKAARGYLLAEKATIEPDPAPRNAVPVSLTADQSAETAARDVLRECFDQISANVETTRVLDDPEGPHQLRVGLRRLRSAFSLFRPVIGAPELARLNAEARWLGQEVGRLRDLDVAVIDILDPEARAHPGEPGFAVLRDAIERRGAETREKLRDILAGPRVQSFLLDLARFVEARGWLVANDYAQTARLAQPVSELARAALAKRWKSAQKHAKGIESLSIEARHELRKELKKLRYAIEFMGSVYPPKRVEGFVRRLKKLQGVFGDLNDAAMAGELFAGSDAPGAGDTAAQRAAGWILGSRMAKAEHGWSRAQALWHDLEASKPFWR